MEKNGLVNGMSEGLCDGFGSVPGARDNKIQQVEEDEDVDGEQANVKPRDVAVDLEEFPGKERSGDCESQELAPGFLEIKANAFDHGESSVAVGDEADSAQDGVVDERGLFEEEVDQARLGIEAEMAGEEIDLVGDVLVEEAVRSYSDADEEEGVEEFIDRDCEQQRIAAMAADTS